MNYQTKNIHKKIVPDKIIHQVQKNLLSIPGNSLAAMSGKYRGWLPAKDYSPIVQLMQQLKVGPYSD